MTLAKKYNIIPGSHENGDDEGGGRPLKRTLNFVGCGYFTVAPLNLRDRWSLTASKRNIVIAFCLPFYSPKIKIMVK